MDPAWIDLARMNPARMDIVRMDPVRMDPTRMDLSRMDPTQMDPAVGHQSMRYLPHSSGMAAYGYNNPGRDMGGNIMHDY